MNSVSCDAYILYIRAISLISLHFENVLISQSARFFFFSLSFMAASYQAQGLSFTVCD